MTNAENILFNEHEVPTGAQYGEYASPIVPAGAGIAECRFEQQSEESEHRDAS